VVEESDEHRQTREEGVEVLERVSPQCDVDEVDRIPPHEVTQARPDQVIHGCFCTTTTTTSAVATCGCTAQVCRRVKIVKHSAAQGSDEQHRHPREKCHLPDDPLAPGLMCLTLPLVLVVVVVVMPMPMSGIILPTQANPVVPVVALCCHSFAHHDC